MAGCRRRLFELGLRALERRELLDPRRELPPRGLGLREPCAGGVAVTLGLVDARGKLLLGILGLRELTARRVALGLDRFGTFRERLELGDALGHLLPRPPRLGQLP